MAIIYNYFKGEVVNKQILTKSVFKRRILASTTKIYHSPHNILTRVDDKRLLVKNTLKVTKEDINAENRSN